MKRLLVGAAIAAVLYAPATAAQDVRGTVVNVNTVTKTSYREVRTPSQMLVCEDIRINSRRKSHGLIEKGTDSIFGSTEGLLGTIAGVAIGSQIGDGAGREAARIVGGALGNQIGNDVAYSKSETIESCYNVTRYNVHLEEQTVIDYYQIAVEYNGVVFTVNRNSIYYVGNKITINVQ